MFFYTTSLTTFFQLLVYTIRQRAFSPKNDAKFVSVSHDYVLMYARDLNQFSIGKLERTAEANARYKNPDHDPRGLWQSDNLLVKSFNPKDNYPITTPSGKVVRPGMGQCWRYSEDKMAELIADNRIYFGKEGKSVRLKRFLSELKSEGMVPTSILQDNDLASSAASSVAASGAGEAEAKAVLFAGMRERVSAPQLVSLFDDLRAVAAHTENKSGAKSINSFLNKVEQEAKLHASTSMLYYSKVGNSQEANDELVKLLDGRLFDGPKPVRLLRHLMTLANLDPHAGDIVLDFFSGSATTAEAVMRANAEDGGNRRFILVQLPEECDSRSPARMAGFANICEIGKERIRRAAANIAATLHSNHVHQKGARGGGY